MGWIVDGLFDWMHLEKEDPDYDAMEYRGGAPVVPPQEFDNDGSEAVPVRSTAVPDGSGAVPVRSNTRNGLFRWWRKPVRKDEVDAMWWAKSARNTIWYGSYPVRIALFAGGVAVVLWTIGTMQPLINVATAAVGMIGIFLVCDPFRIIHRRFAVQSRVLVGVWLGLTLVCLWHPCVEAFAVCFADGVISAALIALCNTEWLVEINYMSSATIYDAMRNDPQGSAHQSWCSVGARECMTFCSEFGYFITSPYWYRVAQGIYTIAWIRGRSRADEETEEEWEEDRDVGCDGRVWAGATQEDYDALFKEFRKKEAEAEGLKAYIEGQNALWESEASDKVMLQERIIQSIKTKLDEKQIEIVRIQKKADDLKALNEQLTKENRQLAAANEELLAQNKELAAANEEMAAAKAREGMDENADDIRRGRIRKEWDAGNRSARKISQVTGYPASTVQRIINAWKGESE